MLLHRRRRRILGSELITDLNDNITTIPASAVGITSITAAATPVYTPTAGSELITDQHNRDFSDTSEWANVDINAFDSTGDLTITANAADQYCTLPEANAPMTAGYRYVLTIAVANLVSDWIIKDFDGTNTLVASGNLANGANTFYFNCATTGGGFRLVSTASDSSGDFDDFSLKSLGPASGYFVPAGITECLGAELVTNGDFEGVYDDESGGGGGTINVAPNWDNSGCETDGSDTLDECTTLVDPGGNGVTPYSNNSCQYFNVNALVEGIITTTGSAFTITEGSFYVVEFYYYLISGEVQLVIRTGTSGIVHFIDATSTPTGAWTLYRAYFTGAETTANGRIFIRSGSGAAEFYVDLTSLKEVLPIGHGESASLDSDYGDLDGTGWTDNTIPLLGIDLTNAAANITDGSMIPVSNSDWTLGDGVGITNDVANSGEELSSGTCSSGTLYFVTATEENHFGTGVLQYHFFVSAGTETLDANNKVFEISETYLNWNGTQGAASLATQESILTNTAMHRVTYTLTRTAGTLTPYVGTTALDTQNSSGSYGEQEFPTCQGDAHLDFSGDADFIGKIANTGLSAKKCI